MCVELFAVYVDWLYSRKIMPNGKKLWYGGVHADADDWAILARALVLGSSVMDKAFHDSVLDTMVGIAQAEAASEILKGAKLHIPVQIVFGSVPDDSGARSLLVDIFKRHAGILSSCNDEEFPAAFLRTLASEVMEGTEGLEERLSQNKCWYHKHGEGEICGSTTAELHEVARFLP
ncbi:hypothetical protein CB0940_02147 [Cercospora beticola]|nr:hypothetical protein CB0940_02147 [Cercospora beticola]PIB00937.1 hypothetical protein CB0940_02147 [Cercospora beticola]